MWHNGDETLWCGQLSLRQLFYFILPSKFLIKAVAVANYTTLLWSRTMNSNFKRWSPVAVYIWNCPRFCATNQNSHNKRKDNQAIQYADKSMKTRTSCNACDSGSSLINPLILHFQRLGQTCSFWNNVLTKLRHVSPSNQRSHFQFHQVAIWRLHLPACSMGSSFRNLTALLFSFKGETVLPLHTTRTGVQNQATHGPAGCANRPAGSRAVTWYFYPIDCL